MTPIRTDYVTNKHDQQLIAKANSLSCGDWGLIDEDAAQTAEGKKVLHNIRMFLYHKEEGRNC